MGFQSKQIIWWKQRPRAAVTTAWLKEGKEVGFILLHPRIYSGDLRADGIAQRVGCLIVGMDSNNMLPCNKNASFSSPLWLSYQRSSDSCQKKFCFSHQEKLITESVTTMSVKAVPRFVKVPSFLLLFPHLWRNGLSGDQITTKLKKPPCLASASTRSKKRRNFRHYCGLPALRNTQNHSQL